MKFLTHHRLLSDSQHGFREARSCVTQLLQLLHSWFSFLEKGASVDVIFLDFAKAFDKVSHRHLLYKFAVLFHSGSFVFLVSRLSFRPYTKSYYRSFSRDVIPFPVGHIGVPL